MLTTCPECGHQISDKAFLCPGCGFPMKETPKYKPSSKRMRLPNGFGQITEIKGRNLRKPFRVLINAGKSPEGKPIHKPLKPVAYFATYNEAYTALAEYNKKPYDPNTNITVKELHDKWFEYYKTKDISDATKYNMLRAWRYCGEVYDLSLKELRIYHIKKCIDEGVMVPKIGEPHTASNNTKILIKIMWDLMLDYGIEYEYVDRNLARSFAPSISNEVKKQHIAFSEEEINTLWNNVGKVKGVELILIACYSGWRPSELLNLENIDIPNGTFQGGSKTKNGKHRIVPIHSKIVNYVCVLSEQNMSYQEYLTVFNKVIKKLSLDPNHRPHDTRKTFVTMAKNKGVDDTAIKYLVGHAITDLTERVYTERSIDWLRSEIEKI